MIMPFGKHKGMPIDQVPTSYLKWVYDQSEYASPQLRQEIAAVLKISQQPPFAIASNMAVEVVKRWYRRSSLKYHPDHGGSNDKQIVANECYEVLMKELQQLEVTK
jgi:hypothetical protein